MAKGAYMYRGAQKKIISGVIRGGKKERKESGWSKQFRERNIETEGDDKSVEIVTKWKKERYIQR